MRFIKRLGWVFVFIVLPYLFSMVIGEETAPLPVCPYAQSAKTEIQTGYLPLKGVNFYYEKEGQGPPLVLVHGAGPHGIFHPVFSRLKKEFTLVYYDRRGFGLSELKEESTVPKEPETLNKPDPDAVRNTDLEDLDALRQALGFEPMYLLVCSNGGPIGIDYILKHPEHVAKLIFLSSHVNDPERSAMAVPMLKEIIHNPDYEKQLQAIKNNTGLTAEAKTIQEWMITPGTHHFSPVPLSTITLWTKLGVFSKVRTNLSLGDQDWLPELKRVKIPVLILSGRHDAVTPLAHAQNMIKQIPHGQLEIFEQSGHLLWIEEEDKFVNCLTQFLKK